MIIHRQTGPALIFALLLLGACSGDRSEESAAAADTTLAPPTTAEIIAAQRELSIEGRAGRWTKARSAASAVGLTPEQRRQVRRLESLGYVAGSRLAPTMRSVVAHDPDRAWSGLNFFTSGHAPGAVLMDMDGQVLHRWARSAREVWPDADVDRDAHHWRRARLLPGGEVLAIVDGLGIMKLDRRSQLVWAQANGAHHDLEVLPDGDILVLTRTAHLLPRVHPQAPVLEDFIVRLGADGREKSRVSILEAFENSERYGRIWRGVRDRTGDILHTNSLELLDGRIADRAPEFTAGRVLISVRKLDTVAVVDLDRVEVVWAMRGPFAAQHDATILDDGNVMLFDNESAPGVSAVEIYDPATAAEVWRFAGAADRPFYSRTCGTSQRLPGGNLLITESDNGRAFEIDPDGETVWEFFNPHRAGEHGEYIATLFEVLRLPPDLDLSWADGLR